MNPRLQIHTAPSVRAWRNLLCWTALCSVGAPMLSAQTILNETFVTGERLVQDLPNTSAWYGSNNRLSEIPGGIRLQLESGGTVTSQHMFTYFTASGSPVSLSVGETLQVTYQFKVEGAKNAGGGIRLGVLNSGGSRTADESLGVSPSPSPFANYTGYGAFFNPIGAADSIRQRINSANGLFSTAAAWTTLASGGSAISLQDGTLYTGVFTIERTGTDTLVVSHQISGADITTSLVSYTTVANLVTAFDTFGIGGVGSSAPDAIELHDVQVQVTARTITQVALEKSSDLEIWEPADPGIFDIADEPLFFRAVITNN